MRSFLTAAVVLVAVLVASEPAHAAWVWPVRGQVITTYRNGDDPYAGGQHRGIDIAAPVGSAVVAAAGGEVRSAGTAGSSGLTVSVRTSDGFDTSYLHLASVSVREREVVSAGDTLGAVGMTGSRSASEPHLHFGVREAGSRHAYLNPLDFLAPPGPGGRDAPHPAPSPVPVPTPVVPAPAPAPAGEPAGRRVPLGDRAPRRVPSGARSPRRVPARDRAPRRVPAGDRAPRRVPVGDRAPRGVPVGERAPRSVPTRDRPPRRLPVGDRTPRPVPVGERAPRAVPTRDGAPRAVPTRDRAPHGVPDGERAPRRIPTGGPTPHSAPGDPAPREPRGSPANSPGDSAGPDIGWILACVGLLLAAALLGLTEDGRKASRRGRSELARLLRPLMGRG
jgi:Peptidase family M23